MINEERLLNEFIELVSVPCPSLDEKAEADLIVKNWLNSALKPKLTTQAKKQAPLPATYGHLFLRIWITKFPA